MILTAVCLLVWAMPIHAQRGAGAGAGKPATPRAAAPIDLTGYWVSVVTEDWKFRMVTPNTGELGALPLNPEGQKIAKTWDPAKDEAAGEQCRAYGAPAIMRIPGRLHVTWQDDSTLKIETDAGTQTRLLRFGGAAPRRESRPGRETPPRSGTPAGRSIESRDQQPASWIRAQERRAVQQQSGRHRILRPQRAAEWRSVADDYHEGRGPDIFHPALHDQL